MPRKLDKLTLAQHMAFLIAVNRESNLGKLLEFCLTTKVKENTPATEILDLATNLMDNPSNLPYWALDLMGHDLQFLLILKKPKNLFFFYLDIFIIYFGFVFHPKATDPISI